MARTRADQRTPCERCGDGPSGAVTQLACFPEGQNGVMVLTDRPIIHYDSDFAQLLVRFSEAGLEREQLMWTAAVKCAKHLRSFNGVARYCRLLFHQEVLHYRPRVVVTVGKRALKGGLNETSHEKSLYRVKRREIEGHSFWHFHIRESRDLLREPELIEEDKLAMRKIKAILDGEYPKDFRAGKNYTLINTRAEFAQWVQAYGDQEIVALDIETGGMDEDEDLSVNHDPWHPEAYIRGVSLASYTSTACFVNISMGGEAGLEADLFNWITGNNKKLVCHNGKFDLLFIKVQTGVDLFPYFHRDTMLMDGLQREWVKSHGLKQCAARFLPEFEDYEQELQDFFGKIPTHRRDYGTVPLDTLTDYACADVDVTLRLYYMFEQQMDDLGMLPMIEHMITTTDSYAWMEFHGWGHDSAYWERLKTETEQERDVHLHIMQGSLYWRLYRGYREAEERAADKAFWDVGTQRAFTSSECLEFADARFVHRNGNRKVTRTYTADDIEPDATNAKFKRTVLFNPDFLGLQAVRFTEKKQEPQVDRAHMVELRKRATPEAAAIVSALIELQTLNKRLTSFVYPVLPYTDEKGKRHLGWLHKDQQIHPSYLFSGQDWGDDFREGGTVSGRASCIGPNMQQQPTRRGGKKFKKQFRPTPRDVNGDMFHWADGTVRYSDPSGEEWVYIQLDYSQLELRVLAALSGEGFMVDAYKAGEDLHTGLACQLFERELSWYQERLGDDDHPEHGLAADERLIAKTSWFAVLYGSGPGKLVDILSLMDVEMSLNDAKETIAMLYSRLPNVARLKSFVSNNAPSIYTPFGRRRVCLNTSSPDGTINGKAHRQLFNFLVQATGSDIASRGINKSVEWLREQKASCGLRAYPCGAVHDSFILAVPVSELDHVAWNVQQCMQDTESYLEWLGEVPVRVDVETGPNWGDLRSWSYGG